MPNNPAGEMMPAGTLCMAEAAQEQHQPDYPVNDQGRAYMPGVKDDEKTWAMFAHLGLLGHIAVWIFGIGIPLAIWLSKRADSDFIDDHGREAVNFQITLIIYAIGLPILAALIGVLTCGVGLVLMIPAIILPYVLGIIGMIQAATAANRGEFYRYPMTFRFLG
ncbi:MAG: DUF4870 domain-containing protein [Planctomycetota bacterium]